MRFNCGFYGPLALCEILVLYISPTLFFPLFIDGIYFFSPKSGNVHGLIAGISCIGLATGPLPQYSCSPDSEGGGGGAGRPTQQITSRCMSMAQASNPGCFSAHGDQFVLKARCQQCQWVIMALQALNALYWLCPDSGIIILYTIIIIQPNTYAHTYAQARLSLSPALLKARQLPCLSLSLSPANNRWVIGTVITTTQKDNFLCVKRSLLLVQGKNLLFFLSKAANRIVFI